MPMTETPQLLLDRLQQALGPEYELSLYPRHTRVVPVFWLVVRRGDDVYQIRVGEHVLTASAANLPGLVQTLVDDIRAYFAEQPG